SKPAQKVKLTVRGANGKVIREIDGSAKPGVIQRAVWDLRHVPPPASAGAGNFGGGEEGGGGGGGAPADSAAGGGRGRPGGRGPGPSRRWSRTRRGAGAASDSPARHWTTWPVRLARHLQGDPRRRRRHREPHFRGARRSRPQRDHVTAEGSRGISPRRTSN